MSASFPADRPVAGARARSRGREGDRGRQPTARPRGSRHLFATLGHELIWLLRRLHEFTGLDLARRPGGGASGGLGAGLMALLGARLRPRYAVVMRYLKFDELLERADLAITAEGCLDGQSPLGKVPCEVARRAKRHGIPVVALAGSLGTDARTTLAHGIDAFAGIVGRPCTLEEAMADAGRLLTHAAENALRMIAVGLALEGRPPPAAHRPSTR